MENLQQCSGSLVFTLWPMEVGNYAKMIRINLLIKVTYEITMILRYDGWLVKMRCYGQLHGYTLLYDYGLTLADNIRIITQFAWFKG